MTEYKNYIMVLRPSALRDPSVKRKVIRSSLPHRPVKKPRGVLYVGTTNDIDRRMWELNPNNKSSMRGVTYVSEHGGEMFFPSARLLKGGYFGPFDRRYDAERNEVKLCADLLRAGYWVLRS